MWDLIVSVPDHCLSFYFPENPNEQSISLILLIHFTSILFLFDNSYIIVYIMTDNMFFFV